MAGVPPSGPAGPAPGGPRHRADGGRPPGAPVRGIRQEIDDCRLIIDDGKRGETEPDHPLGDFPRYKWQRMLADIPDDLTGCSALDIGCNAGFHSFELARRGAHVTAIDTGPRYLRQAFWAAEKLGLADRVHFQLLDVYDLPSLRRTFDLVLFLGVFYHLRYPLLGLDIVTSLARTTLFFQTLTMPPPGRMECPRNIGLADRNRLLDAAWPKMAFLENALEGDPAHRGPRHRRHPGGLSRRSPAARRRSLIPRFRHGRDASEAVAGYEGRAAGGHDGPAQRHRNGGSVEGDGDEREDHEPPVRGSAGLGCPPQRQRGFGAQPGR
ncbi:MAG: DUF1698 domain-containing protein [Planctomycetes bacterium]|nr:DUF1698 domain-containing protein [Planctomycetota bacterium]